MRHLCHMVKTKEALMAEDTASAENGSENMAWAQLPPPPTPLTGAGGMPILTAAQREKHELEKEYRQLQVAHEDARLKQRIERKRVDMAIEVDETYLYVLQRKSEQRRLRFKHERQEKSCPLCGHRFNYTQDGMLMPEKDWCDVRQQHCSSKGNLSLERINPHCINKAKAVKQTEGRARRQEKQSKGKTARATHPGIRQPVSTNGQHGALASTDQEPL